MKPEHDSSLQAASRRRASQSNPPRTLTPYEWEQWYAAHGVPKGHRSAAPARRRWWQRLLRRGKD